jgi:osmotically-inducible protein OsmY
LPARLVPLRLGSPVCFEDRWKGKVTALDITEHWEVLNLTVSAGTLFSQQSVKLPMTVVKSLDGRAVNIAATSDKAFAREIPPVAAPARPVSSDTPLSRAGLRFDGALLNVDSHYHVAEVLVSRGLTTFRVPLSQVDFEGATLRFVSAPEDLPQYYFDDDILEQIKRRIVDDKVLMPDEKMRLKSEVDAGVAILSGNVWVRSAREYVAALVGGIPGVVSVQDEVADDIDIEAKIGVSLLREGLAHTRVSARANLGHVIVFGAAASSRQVEDIERTIRRVPGVRQVTIRLTVNPAILAEQPRA